MRQKELEERLAEESGLTRAAARDEVAETVRRVLGALRKGKTAELPGVGRLTAKSSVKGAAPSGGKGVRQEPK